MSLVRFINDRNRSGEELAAIINYCSRNGTLTEDMMEGVGVLKDAVFLQMKVAKALWHRESGKQYQHIVVSCDSAVSDKAKAHRVGYQVAQFFEDFQSLIYTHTDTNNLHSYIIVNTVNIKTGKKLSLSRKDFYNFIRYANQIFLQNGLPAVGEKNFQRWISDFCEDEEELDDYEDFDDSFDNILRESRELENVTGISRILHFEDEEAELKDIYRFIHRIGQREK